MTLSVNYKYTIRNIDASNSNKTESCQLDLGIEDKNEKKHKVTVEKRGFFLKKKFETYEMNFMNYLTIYNIVTR